MRFHIPFWVVRFAAYVAIISTLRHLGIPLVERAIFICALEIVITARSKL